MKSGGILVAGGQGRLGQALARAGCTSLGRQQLDITDPAQVTSVIEQASPSAIINAAAFANVDAAEAAPELARRINADGAGILARLCAAAGIPLVHVSTDLVFSSGDPERPLREAARTQPASVYGKTKLEGETQVRTAGGRHLVARVSWLFGDDGESFISKMLALASKRDHLQLVSDEYGRPTPFDALAHQLVTLARLLPERDDLPGLLHLGSPHPVNRMEWAQAIFGASKAFGGPSPSMEPVPGSAFKTPARRATGVVLDVSLAEQLLGPMPDWRPACEAAVRTLLSNQG